MKKLHCAQCPGTDGVQYRAAPRRRLCVRCYAHWLRMRALTMQQQVTRHKKPRRAAR